MRAGIPANPRAGTQWTRKASNAEERDQFGLWVDLSANRIAVGGPGEHSNAKDAEGDQQDNGLDAPNAVSLF